MQKKKTKIALLHCQDTLSYGAMMLAENTIHYLSQLNDDISYVVLTDKLEETYKRLVEATGEKIETRKYTPSYKWIYFRWLREWINPMRMELVHVLEDCQVILVLGGDDFSEYYGISYLINNLLTIKSLKKSGKNVFLLGQTIGPFYSWRKFIARMILQEMDMIYFRDPKSYRYVQENLRIHNNIKLTADIAFLDLARQEEGFDLSTYNLEPNKYICFVISGPGELYALNYETYVEGLITLINHLLIKCEELDKKLVLFPHTWHQNDRDLLDILVKKINNNRVIPITNLLLPFQARSILGFSFFTVSQRMHGTISSLQMGIPVVCLSYSTKYSGVIGEYLGLSDLVVEIKRDTFEKDINNVCTTIDRILKDYNLYKNQIDSTVKKAKKDALTQLIDISKLIEHPK